MHQKISGLGPWENPVDGQSHIDIFGTHFQYYWIYHSRHAARRVFGKQGTREGTGREYKGIIQHTTGE
jgi:hypothetical protein